MRRDYFQRVWVGRPPWRGQGRAPHPASKECHSPRSRVAPALVRVLRRHVLAGGNHADLKQTHGPIAGGVLSGVRVRGEPVLALLPPSPPPHERTHTRSVGHPTPPL